MMKFIMYMEDKTQKNVLGEDQLQANKDGLASLPSNPFKVGSSRVHPVEKALKE